MKKFDVPPDYRSSFISTIKSKRREADRMKKDFSPTILDYGPVQILLARHFGFCYGVENAIEIAFKTIEENPEKKIYLLSEMIHNPHVNADLKAKGVAYMMDTRGNQLIPFERLKPGDIVIVPAFGTTLDIEKKLMEAGVDIEKYDTTCPFVEKVWNRSEAIAKMDYTIVIHGKPEHEETRATFSHSAKHAPTVVVRNLKEAIELAGFINGTSDPEKFYQRFSGQYSEDFVIEKHLEKIGVVNQTTMLASETQEIADYLKQVMIKKYKLTASQITQRFADTRDTLCYATNDNQGAVYALLNNDADLALVIGGYNSSNTSHLVELCEQKLPTYFINSEKEMVSSREIHHFDYAKKERKTTLSWLPERSQVRILLTSGASCPDALVEGVINKVVSFFPGAKSNTDLARELEKVY